MSLYDTFVQAGGQRKRRGRFEVIRLSNPAARLTEAMQKQVLQGFARETDALYQADTSFHWQGRADYFQGVSDTWTA